MTGESRRGLLRPALAELQPYEPGKPVEEVQRELGLERVVKLASNEGPFGPFPAALDALAAGAPELNRYPDGGAYRLRLALAERHDVAPGAIALGAGADGVLDTLTQATLDPGDELVCGWPSFPSYVIYARRQGATPVLVPLRDLRYDLDAVADAVTPRTKLVCIAHPNNPTGTSNGRAEVLRYLERVPEHVLTVLDQAYFEYVTDPDYVDGVEELAKQGRRVLVLRTFSKIFGLAGLRIGYGVGPADVVAAICQVRRPFDLSTPAQSMALASLGDEAEVARRRRLNAEGRGAVEDALRDAGFAVAAPAVANFVYAAVGDDARPLFEALLRLGVIVRPLQGFGSPGAIRVSVGTPDETAVFAAALAEVATAATP
ncbi:MAG TPA: histidinol-phosphate transaminase [Gaiellaceae bacterium]|nr:histidinol-phosphate transaminase [Gaiellaceae bacterium]